MAADTDKATLKQSSSRSLLQSRLRLNLRNKLVISFALIAFFVAAIIAGGLFVSLRNHLLDEFQRHAAGTAGLIALSLDVDQFDELTAATGDLYQQLLITMLEIQKTNPDIIRLVLLRRDEQGFFVVIDAAKEDYASFGQRYPANSVLEDGYNSSAASFTDEKVSFAGKSPSLMAYAPLITSSGEKVGVVGVSLDANSVVQKENDIIRISFLVMLIAVPLGILFGYGIGNTLADPIVRLTQSTRELAAGRLHQRLKINTQDEVEDLANSFNAMADQVQELVENLEIKAQERTQQLSEVSHRAERRALQMEAVAQVARTIAAMRDLDQILPAITRVIGQQFGYYHVGIFLVDERQEHAILRATSSSEGQKMLERGFKVSIEPSSPVGYAAGLGTPRMVLDTGSEGVSRQNPDLPNTRSELALPLVLRGRVIGVLDVHSLESQEFTSEELSALKVLADQIGMAIENAWLFSESRSALEDARKVSRELMGRDWSAFYRQLTKAGYKYDGTNVKPIETPITTAHLQDLVQQGDPILTSPDNEAPKMIVPIKLRGEVIGLLNIEANASGRKWTREEITIAQAAAERAALALENSRLVNEAQRRAAKERTIGEISGKIGSLIDIDNILQTAAQELGRTMPGTEVVIQFQPSEDQ